jgi:16S rRNA (uracil1498-N3)-methyltransferase
VTHDRGEEAGRSPSGDGGPHVFVDDLERPALDPDDHHHLERVLRLRAGDPLTASDGRGRWRACRFGPSPEPAGPVVHVVAPEPEITVAFALTKGERPELAVQKLTELGVDRIACFPATRSVVRWDEQRRSRNVARLRRVAREASMQSRRVRLPAVEVLTDFASAARLPGAALAERSGAAPSLDHTALLVGPEGGWAPEERALDLPSVALGEQVLRAETAAIVAGALLAALRGGLVRRTPVSSRGDDGVFT